MDPEAAIALILNGDEPEAKEALCGLTDWIAKGGFLPAWVETMRQAQGILFREIQPGEIPDWIWSAREFTEEPEEIHHPLFRACIAKRTET